MKIDIYSRPFTLTDAMENHIREKLNRALSRSPYLAEVSVTLRDINGPRGGEDKQCKLQFTLAGLGRFVIKDTKSDLYNAIDSATQRARHAISRAMNRRRKSVKLKHRRARKLMFAEEALEVSTRLHETHTAMVEHEGQLP